MTGKPQSPRRRRRSRRRTEGQGPLPPGSGAAKGTPRFLARPQAQAADVSSASEKEARQKGGAQGQVSEKPVETPLGLAAAEAMRAAPKAGRGLSKADRAGAEARMGADFSDVSVTYDSPLATHFGANAITFGDQIHVAGQSVSYGASDLLNHELTHVAQQRAYGSNAAQFDLNASTDTGLGILDFTGTTNTGIFGKSKNLGTGLDTTISFMPDAAAPYSNRIGLIQTVEAEKLYEPDEPNFDYTGGESAEIEDLRNDEGMHVDMLYDKLAPGDEVEPYYWSDGQSGNPDDVTNRDHWGWNRSPTDREAAELGDFPKYHKALRFNFETVAKGRDNQVVYGAARWGFEIAGTGVTTNEYLEIPEITTSGTGDQYQSEAFDQSVEKFQQVFIHEPAILYFNYNETIPTDAELGKLSDVPGYMAENPDVIIDLTATSDMQGGGATDANRDLAVDRMNAVYTHLMALGIDASRIVRNEATAGASNAEGSQDPAHQNTEGSYQANRRVTVTFQNTVSMPP